MRPESQYIDGYLAATADPATRYTPWTYLKYSIRGTAWSSWSRSYYDALMNAISRRLAAGTVIEVRSVGGSIAYAPAEPHQYRLPAADGPFAVACQVPGCGRDPHDPLHEV